MYIERVTLHVLRMELKSPFKTSLSTVTHKEFILVEVVDTDGVSGWGESVAFSSPWYSAETLKTNWHMLEDFLIPRLFASPVHHPKELDERFSVLKGNRMAKAALETAVWDAYAKKRGLSLAHALGGEYEMIEAGVAIGIGDSITDMLNRVEQAVAGGYRRIKVKIKPGWDIEVLAEIRRHFPDIPLMADANSAYQLTDIDHLRQLDQFQLMMIEQPLAADDIVDHATLQKQLTTPICLDESIESADDVRKAIALGSCRVVNIKIGRVGGLTVAKKIHDLCQENGIPVWCGGMLEAGVGRAHNIALTSLPNFTLPGDTSASSRYWDEDIIEPEVEVKHGRIRVPQSPGIGFTVNREKVRKYTRYAQTYRSS